MLSKKTLSLALTAGVSFGGISLISNSSAYAESTTWDFSYTGSPQNFAAPYTGTYQVETWGAQGGGSNGGRGGYSIGDVHLNAGQTIYVYVGEQGSTGIDGIYGRAWNGGGSGDGGIDDGGGGGATDIRTQSDGFWYWDDHLSSRIIVAGGGGGAWGFLAGGYGGGGYGSSIFYQQADYQSGAMPQPTMLLSGEFGIGSSPMWWGGGGGGGWYGGGANELAEQIDSGQGGSSYIGGVSTGQTIDGDQSIPSPNGGTEIGQPGNGYARITLIKADDTTPPTTQSSISGTQGSNGWYVGPVQLSLSATDDSGVAGTYYGTDGGSWQTYTIPVSFSNDGKYNIEYYSVDTVGNKEAPQTLSFNIDQTAPTFSITAPTNGSHLDDQSLTVAYSVSDILSGVDNSTVGATLDGQSISNGTTIPLYTLSLGSHTFTVSASDNAGNAGTQTVTFQVGTSLDSLQQLVSLFTSNGSIDIGGIAKALTAKLDSGNLQAFVNQVQAQSGKHISATAATYLLRDANFLIGQ